MRKNERHHDAQFEERLRQTRELFGHLRRALELMEQMLSDSMAWAQLKPQTGEQATQISAPPTTAPQTRDKLFFTIKEVSQTTGLGRSTIYKAISDKKLGIQKCGNRTLISAEALQKWIGTWALPT